MAATGEEMRSLALTPTWSVAVVLTIFVAVSLLVERSIHRLSAWLEKTNRKPLFEAVEKMKEELMLLGFISLLLTATSSLISNICIESKFYNGKFSPCTREEVEAPENVGSSESNYRKLLMDSTIHLSFRRVLSSLKQSSCKEGHEPFVSYEGLEQLHRFIFVMAITHVSYGCLTMLLAIVKIHTWRKWEDEAHMDRHDSLNEITRALTLRRQSTFVKFHTSHPWSRNRFLVWVTCFFRQFGYSVARADYLTLRTGFISNHNLPLKYDFHSYMIRSMEDEFKMIVGVSAPLWGFVVAFMLFNINGSNLYFFHSIYDFRPPRSLSSRVMSTLRFKGSHTHMDKKTSLIEEEGRKRATLRLSNISSFKAELLEIRSEDPSLHIFLVPGNPGVVSFYKDFVEEVFELLDGNASITAIGHTSHTGKYLDFGRLFSLQDQINHKVDLIKQEVANKEIPIILVGHSIGSYISLEIFKRLPQQVKYYIGLYPFMSMNEKSSVQSRLVKITASSILRGAVSFSIALLGLLPNSASELLVRNLIGQSWSTTAIEAACTRLLRFHTMQNVLYMAMTEFQKFQLSEEPDWTFMREKRKQIAFLFGDDDHWGPLTLYEQICKQVPDVAISIEREGLTHAFSCTEAGSIWVARHVVNLIKIQISS